MEQNYLYTLAFLKRKDEILMLNRIKNPWQGMWNGVGGKRDPDESPLDCIIREIEEETGITVTKEQIHFRGTLSWNSDFKAASRGLYIFYIELPDDFVYETPKSTKEGILEWRKISWINDEKNLGVAYNIRFFLPTVLSDDRPYHYDCLFNKSELISVTKIELAE